MPLATNGLLGCLATVKEEGTTVAFDTGESHLDELDPNVEQMTLSDLIAHIEECTPDDHWVEFPARVARDLLVRLKEIGRG